MNRVDRIDQLRNVGIETSYLLDSMIQHFSEDDIKEFYEKFVREHDITFGEEEEEEDLSLNPPPNLAELIAQYLKEEEESQKITDEEREEISKKMEIALAKWEEIKSS